jgi:lambda repressor-like predicted transcriptional regulator
MNGFTADPTINEKVGKLPSGEMYMRNGSTVAKVTDQYGDERIIYRQKGQRDLRIKKTSQTRTLVYNRIASTITASKIKAARILSGMTLAELCEKAGLVSSTPKSRMWEIENNMRREGLRIGTVICLAEALGMQPSDLLPTVEEVREFVEQR